MNNLPTVYIPTEPESNGRSLSLFLSLLAHGIVIGLLIYTYQQPTIETVGALETTMVSPEQLAELQGQIMANRAAAAAAASASSTETFASATSNDSPAPTESNSQSVPVFMRSDDAADDSILMSQDQQQRLAEQAAAYERNMAELAAQLDSSANERLEQVEQNKREEINEERERLREFRHKQNSTTTPKVKRPSSTDRSIEIETGSSGSAKTFDLSDGQSVVTGGSSASSSGSSRSAGDYKKGIADKIQRNLRAPIETQGMSARIALRLDSRGNVLSARASGSNEAVNKAAEDAALAASPLPIDLNNPAKYSELTINVVVQ